MQAPLRFAEPDRMATRRDTLRGAAAIAAMLGGWRSGAHAQQPAGTPEASPMVDVDGARLAYVERGSGTPLILVHGSGVDHREWGLPLEGLSDDHRVIAYSRRYHWPNDPPEEGDTWRLLDHAAGLAALIEGLDIAPAHVAGSSYGALVTLAAATVRPDVLRSIVVTEPPLLAWLEDLPDGAEPGRAFLEGTWEPAGAAMERGDLEEGMRLFINGLEDAPVFDQIPPDEKRMIMDNAPAMQLELTAPLKDAYDLDPEAVAQVTVPTLLMRGDLSPRMLLAIMDELERLLPDAERLTFYGVNHVPHHQATQTYNAEVLDFLSRH